LKLSVKNYGESFGMILKLKNMVDHDKINVVLMYMEYQREKIDIMGYNVNEKTIIQTNNSQKKKLMPR